MVDRRETKSNCLNGRGLLESSGEELKPADSPHVGQYLNQQGLG